MHELIIIQTSGNVVTNMRRIVFYWYCQRGIDTPNARKEHRRIGDWRW